MKSMQIYTVLALFMLGSLSCKKFLDKKPSNQQTVASKLPELQGLLDDAAIMNQLLTPSFGEASADDYFIEQSIYITRPTLEQHIYIWKPYDYFFSNDWSISYKPVYNANYCLEMIEKIPRISSNLLAWDNVKGSALFYRSYNFLNLCWNYTNAYDDVSSNSDLGIALRLGTDFNVPSSRASVQECYQRIISDASLAAELLPALPSHSFRPSRAAAYGLLSRVYLSMRKYDSAYKYSNLCLSIKNNLIDFKNSSDPGLASSVTSGTAAVFKRFNQETIFYSEMNSTNPIFSTLRAKIDTTLFSSYLSTDLRRTGFFRADGNYRRFRGSYAQSTTVFFSGLAVDEMMLIKAECLARGVNGQQGDKDAALAVLNALLSRRHTNSFSALTATSPAEALEKVLLERRKELVMRGLRWADIKRLNREGKNYILKRFVNNQNITLLPNANYYALPLPTDIINLTSMPQNPL